MTLCVLSCSAQYIPNSWRERTMELDCPRRNWNWGGLKNLSQKQDSRNRCMRPSWRCLAVTSGAPGVRTLKGKRYLFLWSVNNILFWWRTWISHAREDQYIPTTRPNQICPTERFPTSCDKSRFSHNPTFSHNFQHTTLRSRWIGTTSPRLMRTLPSGTLHGWQRHLRRLALLYKQSPKRNASLNLYKTARASLHLPTRASWKTIGIRDWTLKTSFSATTTLRDALRAQKRDGWFQSRTFRRYGLLSWGPT